MRYAVDVSAGPHMGTIDDRRNVISSEVIVLVEGNDQQTVVSLRPFGVFVEMHLEPGVAVAH